MKGFGVLTQMMQSNGNPQTCALVQDDTVINIIVADPNLDPAPEGCILIGLSENNSVSIGWKYDKKTNTFNEVNI